jgi:hypothetical protein
MEETIGQGPTAETTSSPFTGQTVTLSELRDELLADADQHHAGHPQYDGYFDNWGLGVATCDVFDLTAAGEYVLMAPIDGAAWPQPQFAFYSRQLERVCIVIWGMRRVDGTFPDFKLVDRGTDEERLITGGWTYVLEAEPAAGWMKVDGVLARIMTVADVLAAVPAQAHPYVTRRTQRVADELATARPASAARLLGELEAADAPSPTMCACGHRRSTHDGGIGICDDCDCGMFRPAPEARS